ncbi:MAG TPA: twin-arginine translocase subunit TatC [Acidimicrobiales bacterium]|nr:twin-arginine translocase subunit TatC [Acidimicrobiales bacterium]
MSPAEHGADGRMSMLDHLFELRDRIIKCAIAIAIGGVAAWFLYPQIFDLLLDPYCRLQGSSPDDCLLLQTEPLEGFSVRLKIAGYGGIALAMPVLLWQVWRFVTPGLYSHEKKWAYPFVGSALVLFLLGAGLAYYSLTPALEFLVGVGGEGLNQEFRPAPYFELITYMMLAFGVGFEFPIVLIFLQLAGILSARTLRQNRRYAVVVIVVIVAVITPSGDPYTLGILSIPMYLFYEASIIIGTLLTRKRRREEAATT